MAIRLYSTLSRTKEVLVPDDPRRVTMYVCGPTVYDRAHIGNARPAVVFDVLRRMLGHVYGDANVLYARNITDIDDKIITRADSENVSIGEITRSYEALYLKDMGALGVRPPDLAPHATTSIAAMVAMIDTLITRGHAYAADGHVLFEVGSTKDYGRLSRRPMDEMIAVARVEMAPYKRAPADFVLWKPSTADQPGWDSPWGRGRPGWHIECSAMIAEYLGETIDIHGGGLDLQFPHHENELAQSTCAHGGAALARIWMHNGFLNMSGDAKMSKSLGNVVTVGALLEAGWSGEVLRLALLSAQYRQPLEWTERLLAEARARLERWCEAADDDGTLATSEPDDRVLEALADDLNTPAALEAMSALASAIFVAGDPDRLALRQRFAASGRLLGFGRLSLQTLAPAWLEKALANYAAARAERDFVQADAIRADAAAQGIKLVVTKDGTSWRRA